MVASISQETDRSRLLLNAEDVVGRLNRKLVGWANYFCLGPVSPAYRTINDHVTKRLRRWLCSKHKVRRHGERHATPTSTCTSSWDWSICRSEPTTFRGRTHECLSESRMRVIAHVRFDERGVETELWSG